MYSDGSLQGPQALYALLQVKATVQNGDLMHAADMLCSISFDRDDEFFATAGVSRRIKVGASCRRQQDCLPWVHGALL